MLLERALSAERQVVFTGRTPKKSKDVQGLSVCPKSGTLWIGVEGRGNR